GRNAKLLKKRNLLNQAGKGTSCLFTESRTGMAGKTANVHFINDGAGRGQIQWLVTFPIVCRWIDYHDFHGRRGVRTWPSCGLTVVILGNDYTAAVRVK